jgi:autotransporter-associated beta strand protein
MAFGNWRTWFRSLSLSSKRHSTIRRHPRRRPLYVEQLEGRWAPATDIWTGLGNNVNWSTPANWSNGRPNPGDDLVFAAGVPALSQTNNNDLAAGTIFNSITLADSNYMLSGHAITLGGPSGGNSIIVAAQAKTDVVAFNITLGGAAGNRQFFTVNSGGDLTLSGKLIGTTGVDFTKEGTGLLTLSNDNSGFIGPITVAQGVLLMTNALALGDTTNGTTVLANAQLQVANGVGTVKENLLLNGPGTTNDGALLNVDGANTWAGKVVLDSDVTLGAAAGSLNITGQISDRGAGHNLTKEGAGQIIFSHANTYRGLTTINNGILTIRDPLALGASGTPASGTIVNTNLIGTGTLQLEDPTGVGFTVLNEQLTLNGNGVLDSNNNPIGALDNLNGDNTWASSVLLGSPAPNGASVSIGVEEQGTTLTNLTISGVISDPNSDPNNPFSLTKLGPGRLILNNSNTYRGFTDIAAGIVNIRDSQALGAAGATKGTIVENNAALELEIDSGLDAHGRNLANDSITHLANKLFITEDLTLNGRGFNGTGALHSISGINTWAGPIVLVPRLAAIGVEPDPNPSSDNSYFTNDFSLTVIGGISGGTPNDLVTLAKVDPGQLILPNANSYLGPTLISQGWITVQDNQALGLRVPGIGDTVQPTTTVQSGAALHLKPLTAGADLNLPYNLVLAGTGITHPFGLISQKGALMNLGGNNTESGDVQLNGQVGVGVELLAPSTASELTLTGSVTDFKPVINLNKVASGGSAEDDQFIDTGSTSGTVIVSWDFFSIPDFMRIYDPPQPGGTKLFDTGSVSGTGKASIHYSGGSTVIEIIMDEGGGPAGTAWTYTAQVIPDTIGAGGITKLGSKRLRIQGDGTYTGPVDIQEGVLRIQSDTALGASTAGTTVETGTALELKTSIPENTGGISAGLQIINEHLTLNGSGNTSVTGSLILPLTILSDDNKWNGPVTLANSTTLDIEPNTRLTFAGTVDDNPAPVGSDIVEMGGGKLVLAGSNTFRGTMFVDQGILNIQNDNALGTIGAGTVIANGASLELQGDITIAGEPLTIQGSGVSTAPTETPRWFQDGPAPINNGQTPGNGNVTGRISGVDVDPSDPNVIYVATAGGGAWKTKDGGKTWLPLFDSRNSTSIFTGAIAVAPSDPRIIYLGTGEADNSGDSFYGDGVYVSKDSGHTWSLVGPATNPFDRKAISRIVVDPNNPNLIYVADSDLATNSTPGNVGVWRFNGSSWFNLTAVVSPTRASQNGKQSAPPNTPGPDDEFRIVFPTSNDIWSDLALVGGTLFAALGFPFPDGSANSAVFRCPNPTDPNSPVWFIGDGQTDSETANQYPTPFTVSGRVPNGNIKIAAGGGMVYAVNANPLTGALLDIQVTADGGVTWKAVPTAPPNYLASQGWYDSTILTSDGTTVWVGGADSGTGNGYVLQTTDGGNTWTDITVDSKNNGPHTDLHAMALDSNGHLDIGSDGGIWQLQTDNNNLWTDVNGNLATITFNGIDVFPSNPNIAFGGSQDNGTEKFTGAQNWALADLGDGGQVHIDPINPNTVYHVLNGSLFRSTTGGNLGSWTDVLDVGGLYFPFLVDSVNNRRLLVGAGPVLESLDQGNSWINLGGSSGAAIAGATYQGTFVADPDFPLVTDKQANTYDPDTIYSSDGSHVFVTKNHGTTWVDRSPPLVPTSIVDMIVDPRNRDTVYVVFGGFGGSKVAKTTDAGQTWSDITGNLPDLPTYKLVLDPRDGTLYVGNDKGVYESTDGGGTWSRFGAGLPLVQAKDLVLNQSLDVLTVGSYGRSMFQLSLDHSQGHAGVIRSLSGANVWAGPVILAGDTVVSAAGTQILQNGISAASLEIVGTISDQTPGANFKLTKIGLGNVIFSGTNTYGGITEVKQGVLIVHNPLALGDSGNGTFVDQGSALWLESDIDLEPLFLSGDGITFNGHSTGSLRNISNNNTYSGPITLMTNTTIGADSGSTLTITGSIGMDPSLPPGTVIDVTKELTGTVALAAANTFNGTVTVNQGALQVENNQALGTTSAGTVVLDGAQIQMQSPEGGPSVVVTGESLSLSGTGIFGTGAMLNTGGNNTWAGPITLTAQEGFFPPTTPGSTVAFGVATAGDVLTIAGAIDEVAANGISSFGLDKVGPGILTLQQANTYSNVTTVDDGILRIQNAQALGTPGGPPNDGTVVNDGGTLQLDLDPLSTGTPHTVSGETLDLNGSGFNGIGALDNLTGANTWAGAPIVLDTSSAIGVDGGTLTVVGDIVDPTPTPTPPSDLTKVGTGTLFFPTANDYLGNTFIVNGILNISNAGALGGAGGAGTAVSGSGTLQLVNNLTISNEPLQLTGSGFNGLGALDSAAGGNTWASPITLAGDATIAADAGSALTLNQTISESVAGSNLTKSGRGGVFLTGSTSNTYTGTTFVTDGMLLLNKAGATAIPADLMVGDTIGGPQSAIVQLLASNQIADTSAVMVNSDGLFDLNDQTDTVGLLSIVDGFAATGHGIHGAQNGQLTVGGLNMTGGVLLLAAPGSKVTLAGDASATSDNTTGPAVVTGPGTVDLGGGTRTFTVSTGTGTTPDLVISSVITNGSLTKAGTGVLLLTAANTYAGGTQVLAGKLVVDNPGVIGDVTLAGGTLGGTGTVGAITSSAAGGTVFPGDLTGTLNSNTVTWNSATDFQVELDGKASGKFSVLHVTGNVDLGGASLSGAVTFNTSIGDTFVVLTSNGLISGSFAQPNVFLSGKKFSITVVNSGATHTVTLQRIKADTTTLVTDASPNPSTFGQQVTFTATVTPEPGSTDTPTALVTFEDGAAVLGTGSLTNVGGVFTATFTTGIVQLLGGKHNITAVYDVAAADPLFNGSTSPNFPFTVNQAGTTTTITMASPASPSNFGQPVTFTAQVTPTIGGIEPTGMVTFMDGTATLGTGTLMDVGGTATATFTTGATELAVGGHTITVIYGSDPNFAGSTSNFSYTVNKAPTTTTVTTASPASPSNFGQAVTFTVTVTPSFGSVEPTGTVTFKDGTATLGTGTLMDVGGTATATFTTGATQLSGGSHTITAVYGSDTNFAGSTSANFGYTVNQASTTTTITSASPNSPSTFGQQVTFTATVTPSILGVEPTGMVTFKDGATTLGTGTLTDVGGTATATFTTGATQLGGGGHTITAVYGSDPNFAGSTSANFSYTVNQAATTTTITSASPGSPSSFGQQVTFTATVTPTISGVEPTGTVTFKEGSATLGTGTLMNVGGTATATFTTVATQLAVGGHTITAVYGSDANFAGSTSANFSYTVNTAATTTTITQASPSSPSTFGQAVTFTATVTPSFGSVEPTGMVTFKDGGTTLGTGTLTDVGGTATATFTTGATQLGGGGHTITAVYGSDPSFAGSTSANFSYTVNQAATTTTITSASPGSPSTFGQQVTFTATVTPTISGVEPTGMVTFMDGATTLGTGTLMAVGGTATATFTTGATQLGGGGHTITAVYGSDPNFAGSTSANFGYTVNVMGTVTTITNASPPSPGPLNTPVTFTATVTPTVNGVEPTGMVTFKDGATTLGTGTLMDVGGTATATFTTSAGQLGLGAHTITAVYGSDPNFSGSTSANFNYQVNTASTTTITGASPASPSSFGQLVTFTATVTPTINGVEPTGMVTFKDGATTLGTGTLGDVGGTATATFTTGATQLAVGGHIITALYAGDPNFATSTSANFSYSVNQAATTTTITNASPASPSQFGQMVTFTATVTPSFGSVEPTGMVTFKDGGTTLGTGTLMNVGGTATATFTTSATQLAVGGHTITAVYGSDPSFAGSTSANFGFTVNQAATTTTITSASPSSPSTFGQTVTFTATVTPTINGVEPTGMVTFKDGATTLGTGTLGDVGGTATATFTTSATQLTGGGHTITAVYGSDPNFAGSTSANFSYTVNQVATTTTITNALPNSPSTFGQTVTFTATVTPVVSGVEPTGTVTFKDGATTLGSGTLMDVGGTATATFTTSAGQLSVGGHTITAVYGSDPNFAGSTSGNASYTVNPITPVVTITGASPNPSFFSQTVTFTATVTPSFGAIEPTGSVTFMEGSTTLGSGTLMDVGGTATATFTTGGTQLTVGTHSITAVYAGNGTYQTATTTTPFQQTVNPVPTVVTIVTSPPVPFEGTPITFTVTVAPVAVPGPLSGTLTLFDGSTPVTTVNLTNGSASITINAPSQGSHVFTAVFNGGGVFGTGSSTVNIAIGPAFPLVTGSGAGSRPFVHILNPHTSAELKRFLAYNKKLRSGVSVATGDVNGDGFPDIITVADGTHRIKVYDGLTLRLISSFPAMMPHFHKNLFVAAGDVDGSGLAEIVVGSMFGARPQFNVFNGETGALLARVMPFPANLTGGVIITLNDVNHDGRLDIVATTLRHGHSLTKAFDGKTFTEITGF